MIKIQVLYHIVISIIAAKPNCVLCLLYSDVDKIVGIPTIPYTGWRVAGIPVYGLQLTILNLL